MATLARVLWTGWSDDEPRFGGVGRRGGTGSAMEKKRKRERERIYGLQVCVIGWFILYRKLEVEIGWNVHKHEHVNHVVHVRVGAFFQEG